MNLLICRWLSFWIIMHRWCAYRYTFFYSHIEDDIPFFVQLYTWMQILLSLKVLRIFLNVENSVLTWSSLIPVSIRHPSTTPWSNQEQRLFARSFSRTWSGRQGIRRKNVRLPRQRWRVPSRTAMLDLGPGFGRTLSYLHLQSHIHTYPPGDTQLGVVRQR